MFPKANNPNMAELCSVLFGLFFFVIWQATAKRLSVYLIDIERRYLIYKIVQPVRKQQAGMAAPTVKDFLFWVIVLKIMPWNFNGKILI